MLVLSEQLQQVSYSPQAVVQPRIYEALALQATVENQVEAATRYLAQAQGLRESVLSYVLQGKHAELKGDLDGASDAYSEAFYMDTSLETYLLCENLVFHSNLKSIDYAMYARCILGGSFTVTLVYDQSHLSIPKRLGMTGKKGIERTCAFFLRTGFITV